MDISSFRSARLVVLYGLAASFLIVAGCSRSSENNWGGTVVVEDRIVHLYNPDEPLWGEGISPFIEEEVLGGPGSDENAILARPCAVEIGKDRSRYILDQSTARIVRFGPDGAYIGSFGRKGEGPGEFNEPTDLEQLPDGTLAVTDWSGMRISFFNPDGEFIRSIRRQKFSGQLAIAGEDLLYLHEQPRTLGARGLFVSGELERVEPLVDLVGMDGEERGGLGELQPYDGMLLSSWMNHVYLDFAPPDSLVANFMGHDRIEVYGPDHKLARVVHRNVPFIPVEPVEENEISEDGAISMRFEFDILSTGLAIHPDGHYWVVMVALNQPDRRADIEEEEEIPQQWAIDLFDSSGRWLARQTMGEDAAHALLDWGPDGLYLLSAEGDGSVRRYRMEFPH